MTTQRSGNTRTRQAAPRNPGELPYTTLRQRPPPKQRPERSGWLRAVHLATLIIAPVVLLSLAAAAIAYVRLLHGPVSLKAFRESIEQSINANLDGYTAAIEDAVITLADDYTVEMRLIELRLSERDGDLVASAPMAAMELDKGALWRFQVAPERVYLIEPQISVNYSQAQGFSLSISEGGASSDASGEKPIVPPRPIPARPPGADQQTPSFHRIDVARILAETSARARRDASGTSRIREFGVRNATVVISYDGQTSQIGVQEASVDLAHMKRRSVISGTATISSEKGPWSLAFRADESGRKNALKVTTTVRDFVPSTLARISADFGLIAMLDMPMSGELALDLSTDGDLTTANLAVDLGRGFMRLPSVSDTPVLLDSGRLAMVYDAEARRLTLSPSTLAWGGSRITLEGAVTSDPAASGEPQWHFGLQSLEGQLAAEEFGVAPLPIEAFKASGRIIPSEGLLQLAGFSLKAGGGEVTANGEVISGQGSPSTRVEAALSPMPVATLKALWPRAAAPAARSWVGTQVETASIQSASLKVLSGRFLDAVPSAEGTPTHPSGGSRISASMDVTGLRMEPLPKSLPVDAPQATIRLENSSLELTMPQAAIIASETSQLPLKGVRFTVVDVSHDAPIAEFAVKSQAPLRTLIDTLNHSQLNLAGQGPLPIEGIDGNVDGEIKISMPLAGGAGVVKAEGKARITDLKGKNKERGFDLQGGTVDINVSDIGVIAKGDLIINGVGAKVQMHRILDAAPEMQPPLRISAALDNSDRTQLGLDVNHLVQGTVPLEITVAFKAEGPPAVHVRGDLTDAELILAELAWRKAPGRAATVEFDVDTSNPQRSALSNFRVVGDNIAIDGSVTLSEKREVSEFNFPNFSLNVVSRLSAAGTFSANRIWKIDVKGTTFDSKEVFRSLLALGDTAETKIKPIHPAKGVDLTAEIDTVLGHSDISLRNYKVRFSERDEKLMSLNASGTLDGGGTVTVQIKENGPRRLEAESSDAGVAFKLIGFYPNLQGGKLKLEVDLEGRGDAEKSGVLWVDNFRVLGDPIISEVYSSIESSGTAGETRKRQVQREVFEFQRLKAPFSVGHGQFVLDDSYIRGPLLGASLRGKVDYNSRRLSLGGTYVPLQGINSALCEIPLVGPIVSGFDCQGVFGITYAIQGPMSSPEVIVNPLSMFTPGILRAIMEMTNPNPQVQAPVERQKVRASTTSSGADEATANSIDGWSSETTTPTKKQGAKAKQ